MRQDYYHPPFAARRPSHHPLRTTHLEPVARACFGLSMPDMCEIARNSVLQSGFSDAEKADLLGENWDLQDRFR